MLDNNDMTARQCAYFKGKCDVLSELEIELKASGVELPEKARLIMNSKIIAENNRYELFQHQYIDDIGGNKSLKV